MSVFTKRAVLVDGIRVEVLEAGSGEPLIYFHGAGTTSGFQDLLPLSRSRRLIVPIHPGFGASDDDAGINSMLDYVVHYNTLFDQLDLSSPTDRSADSDPVGDQRSDHSNRAGKAMGVAYSSQRGRDIRGGRAFVVLRGARGRWSTGVIPR
jgi:hypothetical protein